MEVTRETVLAWLETTRRSQTWLADQCGVSKQAVSNWLREKNPQPISAAAQISIWKLMEADQATPAEKPAQNLVLEFTDEEFATIGRAALASNELVPQYAKRVLNEIAGEDVARLADEYRGRQQSLRVAEDPKPYRTAQKTRQAGE